MKYIPIYLFIFAFIGCQSYSPTEIHLDSRDNVIDVNSKIVEILTEEPFISSYSDVYLLNNCLIIKDWKGYGNLIHLFDKNTFKHLKSTGTIGQGPNEIANIGNIFIDERRNNFYVVDQGKLRLLSYNLDSLMSISDYNFTTKTYLISTTHILQDLNTQTKKMLTSLNLQFLQKQISILYLTLGLLITQ